MGAADEAGPQPPSAAGAKPAEAPAPVVPAGALIEGEPPKAVAGAPDGSAGGKDPSKTGEAAEIVPRKKYKIHKLFNALFKLIGKKVLHWKPEQIEEELTLDENECELVDDAFEPLMKKLFKSLGVGDDYMEVLVAVILVIGPRIITVGSELQKQKKGKTEESKSDDKKSDDKSAEKSEDKSEHSTVTRDASWTWKGVLT